MVIATLVRIVDGLQPIPRRCFRQPVNLDRRRGIRHGPRHAGGGSFSFSRRPGLALAAAIVAASSLLVVAAPSASAYPSADVRLEVHGFGHGRGMGQYGALGYAVGGSTYQQIISHYYGTLSAGGTTSLGPVPAGNPVGSTVRVDIVENDGMPGSETFPIVTSNSAFTVGGTPVAAGQAAEIVPTGANRANVFIGTSCSGPWPPAPSFVTTDPAAAPATAAPFPSNGPPTSGVLTLCLGSGNLTVRGQLMATQSSSGDDRTVNVLPTEQYVADTAAAESPGTWGSLGGAGPQGQPWGFQSTEAQAVAVRSYAASAPGGYGGYADTCDTTACQVYPGVRNENAWDDLAAQDTAGQVVLMPSASPGVAPAVARTEYSASTGGYTAPGTFAPVVDDGDAAACATSAGCPYHDYTVTAPVGAVEQQFPQIGTLTSIDVTGRNGFGDFGGRVTGVDIIGTGGSVSLSGTAFASDFARYGAGGVVMSDWFRVESQPSGGTGGYWLLGSDGGVFAYGNAQFLGSMGGKRLNAPVVGMAPTADHGGYWLDASDGGIFSFGDAPFLGSMGGKRLNAPVVGMASTPSGDGYWLVASDGGIFSFGDAGFYGSLPGSAISSTVVATLPTADGNGYLVVTADGRAVPYGDAPQFGDNAGSVPGWSGRLVGGATTPE